MFAAGVRRSYVDLFIPTFTQGSDFSTACPWGLSTNMAPMGADEELSLFVYGFNDAFFTSPDDVARARTKTPKVIY